MLLGNAPKFGGFSHWRNWVLFWANAHRHWCLNHNLFRFWPHTCTQTGTETHVLATQHLAAGVCASTLRTPCKPHTEHLCLCLCVCVCLCEVWVVDQQLQLKDVYTLHRVYLAMPCATERPSVASLSLCECAWLMNAVEMSRISAHATPALTSLNTPEHEHTSAHKRTHTLMLETFPLRHAHTHLYCGQLCILCLSGCYFMVSDIKFVSDVSPKILWKK